MREWPAPFSARAGSGRPRNSSGPPWHYPFNLTAAGPLDRWARQLPADWRQGWLNKFYKSATNCKACATSVKDDIGAGGLPKPRQMFP